MTNDMEYIRVTKENLEKEHICCAISNNNDVQVATKKAWQVCHQRTDERQKISEDDR